MYRNEQSAVAIMNEKRASESRTPLPATQYKVALITGGRDRHYVIGLLEALSERAVQVDCIGGDEVADADIVRGHKVRFYHFIKSQHGNRGLGERLFGFLKYYWRLMAYAAGAESTIFHIQWFRKFPRLERVCLTTYLKVLGKRVVFTAHNVDAEARDGKSTLLNRLSLWFLYHTVDHILVHTPMMKEELVKRFGVAADTVTVVPFGLNDVIPQSTLTRARAKQELGLKPDDKVVLFFGTIVPYKGVEDLVDAMAALVRQDDRFRLIIAGPVWTGGGAYWNDLEKKIDALRLNEYVKKDVRVTYLPDADVALFFRASDVSVLPYKRIYQSGVLALSYHQGVPVIAARVGSFSEDIVEGKTGLTFRPGDVSDLAEKIALYFDSNLYRELESKSQMIREYGVDRFSWEKHADLTAEVYLGLV